MGLLMRIGLADEDGELNLNMRELVFGFNDGLVSTFAFVAGLAGAKLATGLILLVGLISALASALSMGFGAWLSTKSEREAYEAELAAQETVLEEHPKQKRAELKAYLTSLGLSGTTLTNAVRAISKNRIAWASLIMRDVKGKENSRAHSPMRDSIFMFVAFIFGALFPLLPYALSLDAPFQMSVLLSFTAAFGIGALKTLITKRSWIVSGLETLIIVVILVSVAYAAGMFIEGLVG